MPTVTFDVASNLDQAWCERHAGTYAGVPTGTFNQGGGATHHFANSLFAGTFTVYNSLIRFNTGSLPDDAIISAATLKIWVTDNGNPDGISYAIDYYNAFTGQPAVSGDWEASSAGDAVSTFSGTMTIGATNNIAFTSFTGISLTGYFGLRIAPKVAAAPTGDNFVDWASVEDGTASHRPQLEVTYDLPAAGVPVAWIRA